MKNYQQKADNYAKAVDFLNRKLDDEFFELLVQEQCEKYNLDAHHLKVIMGIEEFKICKPVPAYVKMNERVSIKTPAMRVKFKVDWQEVQFYSSKHDETRFYFETLVLKYIPSAINFQTKVMEIHKATLELLELETQLMLIESGVDNYHEIKL
jgi:hypothetical protein